MSFAEIQTPKELSGYKKVIDNISFYVDDSVWMERHNKWLVVRDQGYYKMRPPFGFGVWFKPRIDTNKEKYICYFDGVGKTRYGNPNVKYDEYDFII